MITRLLLAMAVGTSAFAQHSHVGRPQHQQGSAPAYLYEGGDSITAGYGTKAGYPALLITDAPVKVYNAGVNGQRMSQIATQGAAVDGLFSPGLPANIESALACTNDLLNGVSAADCFAMYKAYHLARKAAGWKVIAWTLPSLNGAAAYTVDAERVREEFNALLIADHDWADALVRVDLTQLGCDACFKNMVLFQSDGVHPTDAGQAILAALESIAVAGILTE